MIIIKKMIFKQSVFQNQINKSGKCMVCHCGVWREYNATWSFWHRRSLDLCRYKLACVWMLEGHTYLKYISSIPTCSCYTTATTSNNTANRRAPCIGVHRYDFYVQTRKLPGTVQVAHLHCISDRYGCKYLSTDTQRFAVCQMN